MVVQHKPAWAAPFTWVDLKKTNQPLHVGMPRVSQPNGQPIRSPGCLSKHGDGELPGGPFVGTWSSEYHAQYLAVRLSYPFQGGVSSSGFSVCLFVSSKQSRRQIAPLSLSRWAATSIFSYLTTT